MNNIPPKVKKEILSDVFYQKCARCELLHDHICQGRITWEHVFIYAGKQIQEPWAIIPLCEFAHSAVHYMDCGILDKDINKWISLNRANDFDLMKYSKLINYIYERRRLNSIYGIPDFSYLQNLQS